MTPQEHFNKFGYWPMAPIVQRPVAPSSPRKGGLSGTPRKRVPLALKGWHPEHLAVVPAFEHLRFPNARTMFEALGLEDYKLAVQSYYETICSRSLEEATKIHCVWAIKALLKMFEAQVKGVRRQDVSRRHSHNGGGNVFVVGGGQYKDGKDILVSPAKLVQADSRFMADLEANLRRFGVRECDLAVSAEVLKAQLGKIWGVRC